MTDQPTPRCRHCGDPITKGPSGHWAHIRGSGSILYNCQHTVPYGQVAEPPEPSAPDDLREQIAEAIDENYDEDRYGVVYSEAGYCVDSTAARAVMDVLRRNGVIS